MDIYRIFNNHKKFFFAAGNTKWQIVFFLFNYYQKPDYIPKYKYLNEIIRYLSFSEKDLPQETEFSIFTINPYKKDKIFKELRIYDDNNRIIPPSEIKTWLKEFDKERFTPPKTPRIKKEKVLEPIKIPKKYKTPFKGINI